MNAKPSTKTITSRKPSLVRTWIVQTWIVQTWIVLLAIGVLSGCVNAKHVGAECEKDGDCSGLDDGFCTSNKICEAPCSHHDDCGCYKDGVTMQSIAEGDCDTACVWNHPAQDFCARVCKTDDDCEGDSRCRDHSQVPFKICR